MNLLTFEYFSFIRSTIKDFKEFDAPKSSEETRRALIALLHNILPGDGGVTIDASYIDPALNKEDLLNITENSYSIDDLNLVKEFMKAKNIKPL